MLLSEVLNTVYLIDIKVQNACADTIYEYGIAFCRRTGCKSCQYNYSLKFHYYSYQTHHPYSSMISPLLYLLPLSHSRAQICKHKYRPKTCIERLHNTLEPRFISSIKALTDRPASHQFIPSTFNFNLFHPIQGSNPRLQRQDRIRQSPTRLLSLTDEPSHQFIPSTFNFNLFHLIQDSNPRFQRQDRIRQSPHRDPKNQPYQCYYSSQH